MTAYWLTAVLAQVIGLMMWFLGWQFNASLVMPIALFIGTIVPASAISMDLGVRYLPTTSAALLRIGLILVNLAVALAIVVLHAFATDGSFAFLSSVAISLWGTVALGAGLTVLNLALSISMGLNYFKVSSGKAKGLGSLLVGLGSVGLTVPLLVIDLVVRWPLIAMPAMIIALMGQRRLDAK